MGYITQLIQTQEQYLAQQLNNRNFIDLPRGQAYSSYFPTYEVTSPQYQQPTAYSLAQLGYRTNEVAYACIDLWMKTVSEAPIKVYDKKTGEEVEGHPLTAMMENPTPSLSQAEFWSAVIMYLKIAGILAWEKEFSNIGNVISLWPMMPHYCSYMRGERRLMATIRYQPYTGLPYLDIDRSNCVVFSYVDPLYYQLKPFSPTMVLRDVISVDNDMTTLVQNFLRNGAFVSGLLKTEQLIDEEDAKFARERWQQAHGGAENAGQIAVLGKGLEFQRSSNTFREMVFPEVDARNESRICMTYGVKPVLISAKVGMDRSTFNNYEQARSAWYEENVTSEWRFLENRLTRDLLPHFDDDPNHECRFDTSNIKALQENRDNSWKRANDAFKARVVIRDEARKEMGLDPMLDKDLGKELYMTVMEQQSLSIEDNLDEPNAASEKVDNKLSGPNTATIQNKEKTDQQKKEEKAFRRFAVKRVEEKKEYMIGEFEFKYISQIDQRRLLNEFGVPDASGEAVVKALLELLNTEKKDYSPNVNVSIEPSEYKFNIAVPPPVTEISVTPTINVPENQTNITNQIEVNPTPIEVEVKSNPLIEVNTPKINRTIQKVRRDKEGDVDGTVTNYEYKEDQ